MNVVKKVIIFFLLLSCASQAFPDEVQHETEKGVIDEADDRTSQIQDGGKALIKIVKEKAQWAIIIRHLESQGFQVRELATLYDNKQWDEAENLINTLEEHDPKVAFRTVGEILYFEETQGIEACTKHIDQELHVQTIHPIREKTLRIMKAYINGKGDMKSSELVVTVAIVALICSGVDLDLHAVNQSGRLLLAVLVALKQSLDEHADFSLEMKALLYHTLKDVEYKRE